MAQLVDDNESTRGVTLSEVIRRHVRAEIIGIHGNIPANVKKVYTDGSGNILYVDCQIGVREFYRDETGLLVVEDVALVTHVPVGLPGGGGGGGVGVRLTLPIIAGDLGHLVFCDRSTDRYMAGTGASVDPQLYSRWNLTDAVFVPGLRPFGAPWTSWPSDHATLGTDGADDGAHVKIHFRAATITIGDESGAQFVALSNLVTAQLNALKAAIQGWTPVAGDGGAALKTALSTLFATPWPASVAAAQAKAK